MTSKELMGFLRTQGHPVTSHMSTIEDHVATIIRDRLRKNMPKKEPKPSPPPPEQSARKSGEEKASSTATGDAKAASKQRRGETWTDDAPPSRGKERSRERGRSDAEGKGAEVAAKRRRYFPTVDDLIDAGGRLGARGRKFGTRGRKRNREAVAAATERPDKIEVALPITLKDLSSALGIKAAVLMKTLMQNGQMVTINQFLDEEQITLIGLEYEVEITFKTKDEDLEKKAEDLERYESKSENLEPRAPVVTFLGHVDHGKTSLLDRIRKTKVASREAGGITQHISAYRVDDGDVHVAFIDTPGHKAFTEMRARGAKVTDVAVLVVAVDDGVMPQTEEALNHAKAAGVPIVVALNKIDKAGANPDRAKNQLAELGLIPVEWNGETEFVPVSAQTGEGIDTLLETLSLTSEILELKADPTRPAVGVVLEAENTPGEGVVATVLVRDGTLHKGSFVVVGPAHGRIRSVVVNGNEQVSEAGPSTPVRITGLNLVPEAGDKLIEVKDPQDGREIADARLRLKRESERAARQKVSLENLFDQLDKGDVDELRLVLKGDTKGSIAALQQSLQGLATDEIGVRILHSGVGAISQDDIGLADASDAVVIGFHVTADDRARSLAEERKVEIRTYDVIYKAIEDVRNAMAARLAPDREERINGHAEIRQTYRASKIGTIAGCMVLDGVIRRGDQVRLARDGKIVHTGTLSSLKRFKDDAKEVKEGFECGMKLAGYDDIKEGDVIEAFAIVEKVRTTL